MARIRTIKPELTMDEELAELGFAARFFYMNLFCHVDREGRAEDRPRKLQALILPWDPKVDADILLNELSPKFVFRYEIDGKRFLQVRNFQKHQRPHSREPESEIPPPPKDLIVKAGKSPGQAVPGPRGREGKGMERKGMDTVAQPTARSEESSPQPFTPIQLVMRAFKEAKGIDADDREWDKKFFGRNAKAAAELLSIFDGNTQKAMVFIIGKGEEWAELPDWGLEGIIKSASRDYNRLGIGGANEQPRNEVGADRLLEKGGSRGASQVRDVALQALDDLRRKRGLEGPREDSGDADEA